MLLLLFFSPFFFTKTRDLCCYKAKTSFKFYTELLPYLEFFKFISICTMTLLV